MSVFLLMYVKHTIETLIAMMCDTYATVTASRNLLLLQELEYLLYKKKPFSR